MGNFRGPCALANRLNFILRIGKYSYSTRYA